MVHFYIQIPSDYPTTSVIQIREDGALPEYGQVWVWDMFLAQTLFALGDCPDADELKEVLDIWAVNMSSKIHQPFEHIRRKGHLNILTDLCIGESDAPAGELVLHIVGDSQEMPKVTVLGAEALSSAARAAAVIALAQYFIDKNELFAKELPIHILALRKYYSDIKSHTESQSVEEAPYFAIQKALEYYNSVPGNAM